VRARPIDKYARSKILNKNSIKNLDWNEGRESENEADARAFFGPSSLPLS